MKTRTSILITQVLICTLLFCITGCNSPNKSGGGPHPDADKDVSVYSATIADTGTEIDADFFTAQGCSAPVCSVETNTLYEFATTAPASFTLIISNGESTKQNICAGYSTDGGRNYAWMDPLQVAADCTGSVDVDSINTLPASGTSVEVILVLASNCTTVTDCTTCPTSAPEDSQNLTVVTSCS